MERKENEHCYLATEINTTASIHVHLQTMYGDCFTRHTALPSTNQDTTLHVHVHVYITTVKRYTVVDQ